MKIGGNICKKFTSSEEWVTLAREMGYTAVYFPLNSKADIKDIDAYAKAARDAGLVISEVGVWNNTLDPRTDKRAENVEYAVHQLELADYIGANCCVNIAGSYSEQWDGPHRDNLTEKGFADIVDTTVRIIDAAKPKNTVYCLEPMPWMYPHTADSYLDLIKAIDRPGFGAHIDIVNIINSPVLVYRTGEVIREWFSKLGGYIRSCHAKDITLSGELTVHLSECRPGTGEMDYRTYIDCVDKLGNKACLMLEHMTEHTDYVEAMRYLTALASDMGVKY